MSLQEDLETLKKEVTRVISVVEEQLPTSSSPSKDGLQLVSKAGQKVLLQNSTRVLDLATKFTEEKDVVGLTRISRSVFSYYRRETIQHKAEELQGAET